MTRPRPVHATHTVDPRSATPEIRLVDGPDTSDPVRLDPAETRPPRLGELLIQAGVIDDRAVEAALQAQATGGGRLGAVLVDLDLCGEDQVRDALATQYRTEVVDLQTLHIPPEALAVLPQEMVRRFEAIPIELTRDTLRVAMPDPSNLTAIDEIRFFTGIARVVPVVCAETDFERALQVLYKTRSLVSEVLASGEFFNRAVQAVAPEEGPAPQGEHADVVHDLRRAGEQPPIITLCNFLLVEAIQQRASDIHIEAYETHFRVRMRIDGRLRVVMAPPQRLHSPMIARVKILAGMDIAKRRVPQDGHIAIQYGGETCHYRVSTLPSLYGEKCVIRLMKKDVSLLSLDSLGFDGGDLEALHSTLRLPQGLVLVTGPTGSGKTTTLHAGINFINDFEVNIVTLEDPVEATIDGVNHVQIDEVGGVTFATGLRSILRQDPDVVFVGEMRDPEVANIAIEASLTGHLVLSTLHTNSALETLTRLADMGLQPYLVANALQLVVAQRLLRRVCDECAEPRRPIPPELAEFGISPAEPRLANMRKGEGCAVCAQTGYFGRLAVYEVLRVTPELRTRIRSGAEPEEILEQAIEEGLTPLYHAGLARALEGKTTLEEVRRVLAGT